MPRENQKRLDGRQTPDYAPNPVFTRVSANPVDTTVSPAASNAMRLAAALGQIQPELNSMMATQIKDENIKFDAGREELGINDGLTGTDPRHPEDANYMKQWQISRTQKGIVDVSKKFNQMKLDNRHNPHWDAEAALSQVTEELKGTSDRIFNTVNLQTSSLATEAKKETATLADSTNATQGAQDAVLGKPQQSTDFSYQKGFEQQVALRTAATTEHAFATYAEENKHNPSADFEGAAAKIIKERTTGVDSPQVLATVQVAMFKAVEKAKLEHQKSMQVLQQQTMLDNVEKTTLAAIGTANKSTAEVVADLNKNRADLTGGVNPMMTQAQFDDRNMSALAAFAENPQNKLRSLAILEEKNKDGIRLMDTAKGRMLHGRISKEQQAEAERKNQEEAGRKEVELFVGLQEKVTTGDNSLTEKDLHSMLFSGSISKEHYVNLMTMKKKVAEDMRETERVRTLLEGPDAQIYLNDPKVKAIHEADGRKKFEVVASEINNFDRQITEAEKAGDTNRVAVLKQQLGARIQPILTQAVNDAKDGRVVSPLLGHLLSYASLQPFDANGNLKASFKTVYDIVNGTAQDPGLIGATPAVTRILPDSAREVIVFMRRVKDEASFVAGNEDMAAVVKRVTAQENDPAQRHAASAASGTPSLFKGVHDYVKQFQKEQGLEEFPSSMYSYTQRRAVEYQRMRPGMTEKTAAEMAMHDAKANHILFNKNAIPILPGMTGPQMQDFLYLLNKKHEGLVRIDVEDGQEPGIYIWTMNGSESVMSKSMTYKQWTSEFDNAYLVSDQAQKDKTALILQFDANAKAMAGSYLKESGISQDGKTLTAEEIQNMMRQQETFLAAERDRISKLPFEKRVEELQRIQGVGAGGLGIIGAFSDAATMRMRAAFGRTLKGVGIIAENSTVVLKEITKKGTRFVPPLEMLLTYATLAQEDMKKKHIEELNKLVIGEAVQQAGQAKNTNPPAAPATGVAALSIENSTSSHLTQDQKKENLEHLSSLIASPTASDAHTPQLIFTGSNESLSLNAYRDKARGGISVGYGYSVTNNPNAADQFKRAGIDPKLVARFKAGDTSTALTKDQAQSLFKVQYNDITEEVKTLIGPTKFFRLSPQERIVLVDDAFVHGVPAMSKDTGWLALANKEKDVYLEKRSSPTKGSPTSKPDLPPLPESLGGIPLQGQTGGLPALPPLPEAQTTKPSKSAIPFDKKRLVASRLLLASDSVNVGLQSIVNAYLGNKKQQ